MNANEVRLYDLESVTTTIVLREIQPNPDVITIGLYDLDPVTTTVVLREIPFTAVASGTTVNTSTGTVTLTGFAPSIAKGIFTGLGQLILTGFAPSIDISGGPVSPTTITRRIVTMYYAEKRRRTKKVKV